MNEWGTMKQVKWIMLCLFVASYNVFAVSPDADNLKNLIAENRKYMELINVVVSNLAPPAGAKTETKSDAATDASADQPKTQGKNNYYYYEMIKANRLDFQGNTFYLKGDYKAAFPPLRSSQGTLVALFKSSLEKHIKDSNSLLEYAQVKIVRTEDRMAKHLLKLASRDLRIAEDTILRANNNSPYQYRNKLNLYSRSLNSSRLARKFVLASLIEYKTPDRDKKAYKKVYFDDLKKQIEENTPDAYDKMKHKLTVYVENGLLDKVVASPISKDASKVDLLEVNDDNFGILTYNRESILEQTDSELRQEKYISNAKPDSQSSDTPAATNPTSGDATTDTPATNGDKK